jgi:hypothetical protein
MSRPDYCRHFGRARTSLHLNSGANPTMIAREPDLRTDLGLRQETPAAVYDPLCTLFFDAPSPDLATIRAVAREAGAAGWLQHGVTLGGLATRFDGLRRRGVFLPPRRTAPGGHTKTFGLLQ